MGNRSKPFQITSMMLVFSAGLSLKAEAGVCNPAQPGVGIFHSPCDCPKGTIKNYFTENAFFCMPSGEPNEPSPDAGEAVLRKEQEELIERKIDPNRIPPKPEPQPPVARTDYEKANHFRRNAVNWLKKGDPESARENFSKCASVFLECATLRDASKGVVDIGNALKRNGAEQTRMYRSGIAAIKKALSMAIEPEARRPLQEALNEAEASLAEIKQFEKEQQDLANGKCLTATIASTKNCPNNDATRVAVFNNCKTVRAAMVCIERRKKAPNCMKVTIQPNRLNDDAYACEGTLTYTVEDITR